MEILNFSAHIYLLLQINLLAYIIAAQFTDDDRKFLTKLQSINWPTFYYIGQIVNHSLDTFN